jgi:hypothetical protein
MMVVVFQQRFFSCRCRQTYINTKQARLKEYNGFDLQKINPESRTPIMRSRKVIKYLIEIVTPYSLYTTLKKIY